MISAHEWTADRDELLRQMLASGVTARAAAVTFGVSRNAVIGRAYRLKMAFIKPPKEPKPPKPPKPPKAAKPVREAVSRPERSRIMAHRKLEARRLYLSGETLARISEMTGVPAGSLASLVSDLPRRRKTTWSCAAKPREFRLEAMVAHFAGESVASLGRRMGFSEHSFPHWRDDAALVAEAKELAAVVVAERESEAREKARREAAAEAQARVVADQVNAPIFAQMPARHRAMMEARTQGQTLAEVGERFGITRERVRQIEAVWRAKGLLQLGAKPLSESALSRYGSVNPSAASPTRRSGKSIWTIADEVWRAECGKPVQTARRVMRLSDEERERRREQGRRMAAARWGCSAAVGGAA